MLMRIDLGINMTGGAMTALWCTVRGPSQHVVTATEYAVRYDAKADNDGNDLIH